MNQEVALKVLSGFTQSISSTKFHLGNSPNDSILDMLPKVTKEELLHHWTSVQELLKHFWSSYSLTTKYPNNKVTRLKDAMFQVYSKLQEMKESVQYDFRHQVPFLFIQCFRLWMRRVHTTMQMYKGDMQRSAMGSLNSTPFSVAIVWQYCDSVLLKIMSILIFSVLLRLLNASYLEKTNTNT